MTVRNKYRVNEHESEAKEQMNIIETVTASLTFDETVEIHPQQFEAGLRLRMVGGVVHECAAHQEASLRRRRAAERASG